MRKYSFDLESVELNPRTLANYDAVIVATDHDSFDYKAIHAHAQLIIDARGVYRDPDDKVVSKGLRKACVSWR